MISVRTTATTAMTIALALFAVTPAFADATVFVGANTTPVNRTVEGAAINFGFAFIAFEGEYANTFEKVASGAPSLKTGMANAILQPPLPLLGIQPYVTAGGGFYRETLDPPVPHQQTGLGINAGAGVKLSLIGPLGVRVDYRVFKLGNGALFPTAHRIYAGVNLKF